MVSKRVMNIQSIYSSNTNVLNNFETKKKHFQKLIVYLNKFEWIYKPRWEIKFIIRTSQCAKLNLFEKVFFAGDN